MPEQIYKGPERRRFPRIPFWYIVKYRVYDREKNTLPKILTSRSKNLSLGGMLMETSHNYPISSVLEVELDVPLDSKNHVFAKVLGSVVRSTVIEKDKAYDVALEFISIPDEYRSSILRLINAFLQ